MLSQRKPNTIFLREVDRVEGKKIYSIDGDSGFIEPSNLVLLKMGKYMEKMMTMDSKYFTDHFVKDLKTNKPKRQLTADEMAELR